MHVTTSPQVLFRELDGESVLLDLRSQKYFGLDEVGTRVWQLLLEAGDTEVVHRRLLEEFDVTPQRLREDLAALLDRLAAEKLIDVQADQVQEDELAPEEQVPKELA